MEKFLKEDFYGLSLYLENKGLIQINYKVLGNHLGAERQK
jgi:hypothetical protein